MVFNMLPVFFLLIIVISFLLVFAPMVDHVFYLDHKIEESTDLEVFIIILVHIMLVGILIYLFHFTRIYVYRIQIF
jgi:uncharacterized membrane protein YqhA